MEMLNEPATYLYTFACREEEQSLCQLERRSLFGVDTEENVISSPLKIDPSRSPFIKFRMAVIFTSETIEDLIEKIKEIPPFKDRFKVAVINLSKEDQEKIKYSKRREIERRVGLSIQGEPDLVQPEVILAVLKVNNRWYFGSYMENKSVWLFHQKKPHSYSTALSTRVARAVVNIALPDPIGKKAIDPCCGIGTVVVEALSMGMIMEGSDINPLVMKGARENIAHFGYKGDVIVRDIRNVTGAYDAAIIDMPYNLCSVLSKEDQLEMLESARGFTEKLVVVTIEPIDHLIKQAGFKISDRCEVTKGNFTRQVIVCE
ncbi:RNA methyltransferase [Cytobacillus spongiae]|nr:RNA methyltransferase [Cytobacillus spongiae]UII56439.1 RNA methyltransferase [Cytobacillus spongiae]